MFKADYYFAEESSVFTALVKDTNHVWDILKKIPQFLKEQSLGKIDIEVPSGVFLENREKISIGKGTVIEPGVYIKGPVMIGKNCKIRQGAYIRENVILSEGSVVGHCSEIKQSFFFPYATAAHFNYVGDSLLGSKSHLGAGVICSNLRLDEKNIVFHIEGKVFDSGHKKIGVILGDFSQIGCNSVINPGTLVGKNVFCHPSVVLKGVIPSGAKVKSLQTYVVER